MEQAESTLTVDNIHASLKFGLIDGKEAVRRLLKLIDDQPAGEREVFKKQLETSESYLNKLAVAEYEQQAELVS